MPSSEFSIIKGSLGEKAVRWNSDLTRDRGKALSLLKYQRILAVELGEEMQKRGIPIVGMFLSGEFGRTFDIESFSDGKSPFKESKEMKRHKGSIDFDTLSPLEKTRLLPDTDIICIVDGDPEKIGWSDLLKRPYGHRRFYPHHLDMERVIEDFPHSLSLDIGFVSSTAFLKSMLSLNLKKSEFFTPESIYLLRESDASASRTADTFLTNFLVASALPIWWNEKYIKYYRNYKEKIIDFYKKNKFEDYLTYVGLSNRWKKYYPQLYSDEGILRALYTRWESGAAGNPLSLIDFYEQELSIKPHIEAIGKSLYPIEFLGLKTFKKELLGIHPKSFNRYERIIAKDKSEKKDFFVKYIKNKRKAKYLEQQKKLADLLIKKRVPTPKVFTILDKEAGYNGTPCLISDFLKNSKEQPLIMAEEIAFKLTPKEKMKLMSSILDLMVKLHSIKLGDLKEAKITLPPNLNFPIEKLAEKQLIEAKKQNFITEEQYQLALKTLRNTDSSQVLVMHDFGLHQVMVDPEETTQAKFLIDLEQASLYPRGVELITFMREASIILEIPWDDILNLYSQKANVSRKELDKQLVSYGLIWTYRLWLRSKRRHDSDNENYAVKFREYIFKIASSIK